MRILIVLLIVACGAPEAVNVTSTTGDWDNRAWSVPKEDDEQPVVRCNCCWPSWIHGPGRCRFARAASAPVDECESDPAQRCEYPDAGFNP